MPDNTQTTKPAEHDQPLSYKEAVIRFAAYTFVLNTVWYLLAQHVFKFEIYTNFHRRYVITGSDFTFTVPYPLSLALVLLGTVIATVLVSLFAGYFIWRHPQRRRLFQVVLVIAVIAASNMVNIADQETSAKFAAGVFYVIEGACALFCFSMVFPEQEIRPRGFFAGFFFGRGKGKK